MARSRFREAVQRHAGKIRWGSLLVVVASVFVIVRALPVERALQVLDGWIQDLGAWGLVAYGLVYVLAALLFVPGAALTIAAGAMFGLWTGTILVSVASTVTATLAFLIGRYAARDKVAAAARRYRRFGAVDRAIEEGGWRVIALLRLTPVVPFSIGNYLFGLTPVRTIPYVVASWLAMLPGTFLYVYIGHLGGVGVRAATGESAGVGLGRSVLLGVGLVATVVLTVYLTRLAKKKLSEQAGLRVDAPAGGRAGAPWGAVAASVAALLLGTAAVVTWTNRAVLASAFGPPEVELSAEYEPKPDGATFDHSVFDALLSDHVDDEGWVDYQGLAREQSRLDRYLRRIAEVDFEALGRDEKLALLINAYNAFTLRLILDHYPLDSIKDIPADERWTGRTWNIGGRELTLEQIEHEELRAKFVEPRIHFAINCASIGCPPLRPRAYVGSEIDAQLEEQARAIHRRSRWFRFDQDRDVVRLTQVYQWYRSDFVQVAGSILEYARRFAPELDRRLDRPGKPKVRWLDYDWSLNEQRRRHEGET